MPALDWSDADDIGFALSEKFPGQDPLQVRFTQLRQWVLELEDFAGDPGAAGEAALEAIQMAWLEYSGEDDE